jgi:L-ribulose-5-phosphate 4-epimerase
MPDLHDDLLTACRILGWYGGRDFIWGHVSARDPQGRGVWMKSSGYGFEEMTRERLVLVDEAGATLDGLGQRHSEYPIHTRIMRARPDVGAVVHTHWPHVVAFGATGLPLRAISHDGAVFMPEGVPRYGSGELITTEQQASALCDSLGARPAILLVSHGLVAVGSDLAEAVFSAVMLDRAARYQLLAAAAGTNLIYSPDAVAVAKRAQHFTRANINGLWEYLRRQVEADQPWDRPAPR